MTGSTQQDLKNSVDQALFQYLQHLVLYRPGGFIPLTLSVNTVCVFCRLQQLDRHRQSSAQQVCELLAKQNQLMQERKTLKEDMPTLDMKVHTAPTQRRECESWFCSRVCSWITHDAACVLLFLGPRHKPSGCSVSLTASCLCPLSHTC